MSGPDAVAPRCEACGDRSAGEFPEGYHLCARHLKEIKWRTGLEAELKQVVGSWAEGHKLTTTELRETIDALGDEPQPEASDPAPRPARIDHFIEVNFPDAALALPVFHLLREQALLSGFPDIWVEGVDLKIEISGDDTRLDELRDRLDALWIGAHLTSQERLPRRR